jgi:DNA polymerase III gamma/tau subunit
VGCVAEHSPADILKVSAEILSRGVDPKVLISRCVEYFRDLHYFYFTGEKPGDDDSWNASLEKLKDSLAADEIVRALDLALRVQAQLHSTVNSSMLLESFLVKLTLHRPLAQSSLESTGLKEEAEPPIRRMPISVSAPTTATSNRSATETETTTARPKGPPVSSSSGGRTLAELERYIHQNKPAWVPVLQTITSLEERDGTLHVRAKNDFAGKRLSSGDGIEVLKTAYKVSKAVVQLDNPAAAGPSVNPAQKIQEKRTLAKEHDAVKSAIRIFDAVVSETRILEDGDTKK